MRRIFIIRKDLHLTPGKLASQVGHAAELYWINKIKSAGKQDNEFMTLSAVDWTKYPDRVMQWYRHPKLMDMSEAAFKAGQNSFVVEKESPRKTWTVSFEVGKDVWDGYINGIYTKTICEARNLNNLIKAKAIAEELGLRENEDYGFIKDKCLTELKPENEDGTTTVGMWFAPLADEVAHKISKKYPLLRDHSEHSEDTKTHINLPLPKKWSIRYHRIGEYGEQTICGQCISVIDAINILLQRENANPAGMIVIDYIEESPF